MTDALREPWDDVARQRDAATFGIWVFLASEILFFGGLFLGFSIYRLYHPDAFKIAAHETNVVYGTLNTAILMTSSLTMVMAARLADIKAHRATTWCLAATALLGLAFLVVKGFEYREDFEHHLFPGAGFSLHPAATQLFFAFYFAMTGLHGLHVTVGIGLITRLTLAVSRRKLPLSSPQIEATALYWHLVDVIWIMLYPLLYLGGRSG